MSGKANVIRAKAAEAQRPNAPSGLSKDRMMVVLALLIVGVFVFSKMRPGDDDVIPQKVEPVAPVSLNTLSDRGLEAQRQLEVDQIKRRMAALEEAVKTQPGEIGRRIDEVDGKLTREVQALVEAIETQSDGRVRAQRAGTPLPMVGSDGVFDVNLPAGPGNFGVPGAGPQLEMVDPAFPYRRLGGASAVTAPTVPAMPLAMQSPPPVMAQAEPVAAEPALPSPASTSGPKIKPGAMRIPAYSYADLRTLHGVTCPVSSGIGGAVGGLTTTNAPVVLPLVGAFRGPQGLEYEVGRIHLLGFCEGVDRRRPTGMIKVEGLSVVDASGIAHTVKFNGYVVDARDNDLGVRGRKESVRGTQLALSILASGIAGVGEAVSANSFDQVETAGGSFREVLRSGQIGGAVAGGALKQSANDLARYFREYGSSLFDVVAIDAGTPLKLITTEPVDIPLGSTQLSENTNDEPLL